MKALNKRWEDGRTGLFMNSLTEEEKMVVTRHINQKINAKYTTIEFERHMNDNFHNIVGEIATIRRLNQGQIWTIMGEIWQGMKKSWENIDQKIADVLTFNIVPPKPQRRRWWDKIKSWFNG